MADTTLRYQGTVKDGKISLPKRMREEIIRCFDGHSIQVEIKRKRKRRSTVQNAYYWSVCLPEILQGMVDLGNEKLQVGNHEHIESVHFYMKHQLLSNGETFIDTDGVEHKLEPSTSKLTTVEFEEYLDRVRQWAAEYLGVVIPLPNEQTNIF